jgi:hypothetical protein
MKTYSQSIAGLVTDDMDVAITHFAYELKWADAQTSVESNYECALN